MCKAQHWHGCWRLPDTEADFVATVQQFGMAAIVDTAVRRIFTEDWLAAHPEAVAERREVLLRIDPVRFAAACRALATLDLRGAALSANLLM